ncbi:MAG: transcriptional initiation protein Tat, partial [Chloroflexi bacterium]|nr:transcriptional initiation protein Tat [Chloroflexota bacterium]
MFVTRRQFLKSGATLLPAVAFSPGLFRRGTLYSPRSSAASAAGRILVVVQQAGGNDGLNTIIPYGDGRYYDLRPNIAIPQQDVIALNSEVGFHPNLPKFKTLWDSGKLAIVEGVGYPNPSFSHFQSMDIWRFADPQSKVKQGWLGRYLETLGSGTDTIFRGIAVGGRGGRLPPELYSPHVPVTIVESVQLYQFQGDSR